MTLPPARRPLILRIDSAGFPFISGALALAVLAGAIGGWLSAVPVVLLALFFAFFFRDPERHVPAAASDNDVLSPADGEVLVAGEAMADAAPPELRLGRRPSLGGRSASSCRRWMCT